MNRSKGGRETTDSDYYFYNISNNNLLFNLGDHVYKSGYKYKNKTDDILISIKYNTQFNLKEIIIIIKNTIEYWRAY